MGDAATKLQALSDKLDKMLAAVDANAKEINQIRGLVPHLVEGGPSILQYADDGKRSRTGEELEIGTKCL